VSPTITILHRRLPAAVAVLIGLTLVTSLVAAIDHHRGGDLYARLALIPEAVWHGELWRLVTWPLAYPSAWNLVATLCWLWLGGTALVATWGERRLIRFVVLIVLGAGVATSLVGLFAARAWWQPHLGGMAIGSALSIAWGLQHPRAQIRIYEVLVISGDVLAYGTLGVVALFAIFYGPYWAMPELFAAAIAFLYVRRPDRDWLHRLRQRRARGKLGVMRGDRHGGPYYPN
jgi:membrane associated rhomboid family serine protease